jgi:hypothetical protein
MIYFQIFYQILYFPFFISENNIISVKLAQGNVKFFNNFRSQMLREWALLTAISKPKANLKKVANAL